MIVPLVLALLLLALPCAADDPALVSPFPLRSFTVRAKAARPTHEQYCTTRVGVPEAARGRRVVGFEPLPGSLAHHITLYSCSSRLDAEDELETPEDVCSEEAASRRTRCEDKRIVFVWARGGRGLRFPRRVGLPLAGAEDFPSAIRSFRLDTHYGYASGATPDTSGIRLLLSSDLPTSPPWFTPNVWLLAPRQAWSLPPGRADVEVRSEAWFTGSPEELNPGLDRTKEEVFVFAIRVHAHDRSRYNALEVQREASGGGWRFNRSTRLPQSFVPLGTTTRRLANRDRVDFMCVFDTRAMTSHTHQGATKHDEMCNLYLYYAPVRALETWGGENSAETWGGEKSARIWGGENSAETRGGENAEETWGWKKTWERASPFGQLVGVARGEGDAVWLLTRRERVWNATTFDPRTHRLSPSLRSVMSAPALIQWSLTRSKVLRETGANLLALPHSVRTSPPSPGATGPTLWVVDAGAHTIRSYDPTLNEAGAPSFGVPHAPGSDDRHACQPTDAAFSPDGLDAFVSDGYCAARVVQLRVADMTVVRVFPLPLSGPDEMVVPHSLVHVTCDAEAFVVVAAREAGSIRVLSLKDGAFRGDKTLSTLELGPRERRWLPYGLGVTASNRLVIALLGRSLRGDFQTHPSEGLVLRSRGSVCAWLARGAAPPEWEALRRGAETMGAPHLVDVRGEEILVVESLEAQASGNLWWWRKTR